MKDGDSDVEWQISIQDIHLVLFGIIFGTEKEPLKPFG